MFVNDVLVGSLPVAGGTNAIEFEAAGFDLEDADPGYSGAFEYVVRDTQSGHTGLIFDSDPDCDRY